MNNDTISIRHIMNIRKEKTYSKLLEIIKEKNGKFLSDEYLGVLNIYEFQCEFGHTWKTSASAIINNHTWCPECGKITIGNKLRKKNGIEYLREIANIKGGICLSDKYININTKYLWKCNNNHEWYATAKHIKTDTWCPICKKSSNGEKDIIKILNDLKIKYVREYSFDNCRGKVRPLPFDFYLPEYNCCIEYDGQQHFIYRETGIYENKLDAIKENEIIKTEYCKNNGIKLLRIPYIFKKKLRRIIEVENKNGFKNSVDYRNCILIVAGTRPEELKTHNLYKTLEENSIPCIYAFTGQHKNLVNRKIYDIIYNITDNKELNRLNSIVVGNINNFGRLFKNHPYITHVMVQGDTTSALAVALSAFHHGIKVIHLEAGLRTYDRQNPYPEEVNRRIISQIADVHLCPTKQAYKNLVDEKIYEDMFIVGNTVIDNLLPYKDKCEYTNKILVTMHRRENHHWLDQWFVAINLLAKLYPEYEFILPIHPNPNVQKYRHLLENVKVIDPLPYDEMLELLIKCRLVITDSGGLQEECSFLNKKCLTCRKVTERPEAIGQSTVMVKAPNLLTELFIKHIDDYVINYDCPFGDGHSAEKIMKILKELIK